MSVRINGTTGVTTPNLTATTKVTTADLANTGNYNGGQLGNRNLVINGAMQVAQRGTSATVGPNGTGEGYTVVDRIRNSLNGSFVSTFTQSTDAPSGFGNSAKIEITTADNSLGSNEFWHFRYSFEGQDLQSIGKGTSDAKSFTLSFWVKSNKTGVYTTEFEDSNNARLNSMSYTINSSNVWEYKSLTFNPDTTGAFTNDNNLALRLNFWLCSGSQYQGGTFYNGTWGTDVDSNRVHDSQVNLGDTVGNTWQITGVQLEVGDTATPFEHRSYGDELAKCLRYYWRHGNATENKLYYSYTFGESITSTDAQVLQTFPVKMRAIPSLSTNGAIRWYSRNTGYPTSTSFLIDGNGGGTYQCAYVNVGFSGMTQGSSGRFMGWANTTAYMEWDAEL
jgi:hypothetical protein